MPLTLEELLFKLSFCDLYLNCLINLFGVSALVVGVILDRGREESIDEGGLPQS